MRLRWALLLLGAIATPAWGAVEGRVFEDRDGNGRLDPGEPPLAGVIVWWETSVHAATDDAGRFSLDAPGPGIVWVRTPDGFSPQPTWAATQATATIDLGLRPAIATGPAVFIAGADSHSGIVDGEQLAQAMAQATDLVPLPHFVTIIGDIGNASSAAEFADVQRAILPTGVPFVPVVGNHDWDDGGATYRKVFGPPMYSFDSGGVHVLVLNSMDTEINRDAFVAAELALPHEGDVVIAFMHFPATAETAAQLSAAGVDVLFTGHLHANYVPEHVGLKEYVTGTLVMGNGEFTPAGYRVVTHLGGGLLRIKNHTTVNQPVAELVYPVAGSCVSAGPVRFLAAIEVGASIPKVILTVGGSRVPLTPAGGWIYRGEVELGVREFRARLEVGWGDGRSLVRNYDLCVRAPFELPPPSNDWVQLQGGADHRGAIATALEPPLAVAWAEAIGGHLLTGSPVLADGRLYVPVVDLDDATRGGVIALDARSGARLWEARPGPSVRNAPAVGFGQVIFVTADGWLHAVDAATGARSWDVDIGQGNPTHMAPTLVDGRVLVATPEAFRVLDLVTGTPIYTRDPGGAYPSVVSIASTTAGSGVAVTPMPEGRDGLIAWSLDDGREMWRLAPPQTVHMRASPVLTDDTLFVTNVESRIAALDLASGQPRWTRLLYNFGEFRWGLGVAGTPAFAEQRLFVPTSNGLFYALDGLSGDVAWFLEADDANIRPLSYEVGARAFLASPVVTGRVVWIAGVDGILHAVDVTSGEVLWSLDLGMPILSGLVPSPPYLYVGTYDGTVHALIATTAIPEAARPPARGCGVAGEPGASSPLGFLLAVLALAWARRRIA